MSTCRVRHCTKEPVTAIDLDPDKPGGPYSFSMEMPVCQNHFDELNDPATEWACDNFAGSGPEVIVGIHLGELNEWVLRRAMKVKDARLRRHSKNLPRRKEVTLKVRKLGTDEERDVSFIASREEIEQLIESLTKYI